MIRVAVVDATGRPARAPGVARWLARVAPARAAGDVTVALVSDAQMRALNRRYRRKDRATDVLSFAEARRATAPRAAGDAARDIGDIVIAVGVAARQARRLGHPLGVELKVLALHGLLHLLGYDHETDSGQMAKLERRLRRKGGLPEGLTERAAPRAKKRLRPSRPLDVAQGRPEPVEGRGAGGKRGRSPRRRATALGGGAPSAEKRLRPARAAGGKSGPSGPDPRARARGGGAPRA